MYTNSKNNKIKYSIKKHQSEEIDFFSARGYLCKESYKLSSENRLQFNSLK